ncbi:extracellular solute-binding protein [Kineococcus rubinsiae]|uniref:extracellular solute-binding protein n=1 Tax=Kineococcus rubinsiae TaxID=2609562 RepID=UPI0014314328|nr:extracellular solute-binding protein [Kineococcus rubinsiae]NIZ89462.1 extracellular solute-binding protein [Kineococcus rubinsiae]
MDSQHTSRRSILALAVATPLTVGALASCGSSGPGAAKAGEATIWYLSGAPQETIRQNAVDAFNKANPDGKLAVTLFQNDAYKTKIKTAIGANQAPTIIWTWGGGGLKSYADAGQVEDLTSWFAENADLKSKLFETAFAAGSVGDKIYAMPCETVSPIVLFTNKAVFKQVGVSEPTTWEEIMELVPKFNAAGIAPFSLGGQSRWTNMMWLEFMFDRVGGPEVFEAVFNGEADAWSNPASLQALKMIQDLVKANGFINGFQSITADSNADQALLYTGKAAMMLHGAWTYGSMKSDGGDFVSKGDLGYMNFPSVAGGKGDPTNSVGNPSSYLAISSKATDEQKTIAKKYFKDGLLTDAENEAWIASGSVPIVNGIDSKLGASDDAEWLKFVYDTAANAGNFAQSWDQALSPTAAEELLNNIEQLFGLAITPEQFATNMNAVIGK